MDVKQLLDIIKSKYSSQVVYQFYKLLGYNDLLGMNLLHAMSSDAYRLGNPLQLISTFSSGVIDFFYEPGKCHFLGFFFILFILQALAW
jgi:hypothetical protein